MAPPDVRVRLSAEGQAEVVAAFRKVQTEADKSARGSSKSFSDFGAVIGKLNGLLGLFGVALSLGSLVSFVRHAAAAAEELGHFAERVGASVRNVSVLRLAATESDVPLEKFQTALGILSKRLLDLERGAPIATAAFARLGLAAADFKGKDTAEAFGLVAARLGGLKDGFEKTGAARELFGKGAQALIPIMNQLAVEGFGNVTERAERLGVILDEKTVEKIRATRIETRVLGLEFGILATKIAAALGEPALLTFVAFLGYMKDGAAGAALAVAEMSAELEVLKSRLAAAGKGGGGLKPIIDNAKHRADTLKAEADNELKLVKLRASLAEQADKRAFDQGLVDAQEFYRKRREAVEAEVEAEVHALQARKEAILSTSEIAVGADEDLAQGDEDLGAAQERTALANERAAAANAKAQADALAVDGEIQRTREEGAGKILALTQEQIDAEKALHDGLIDALNKEAEIQGRTHQAALSDIDERAEKFRLVLAKSPGLTEALRASILSGFREALVLQAEFNEKLRQAQLLEGNLARDVALVEAKIASGQIEEADGQRRIQALRAAALGPLREQARLLIIAAEAVGSPEAIARAKDFAVALAGIGTGATQAEKDLRALKQTASEALQEGIVGALEAVGDETRTLGGIFRDLASTVVSAIRRILAQIIALRIVKGLFSAFHLEIPGQAAGGFLEGPGTGTSDSILARVSRGEFIEPAARVAEPGARTFLESFRIHGMKALGPSAATARRYGDGGLVGESAPAAPGPLEGRITIGLDDGLVLKSMDAPQGHRLIVSVIGRNRRAIQKAIG